MPLLGYGVFLVSPQECERCVSDALSVGYRLIDTAQAYMNEEGVGAAITKSNVRREDIFLVTKVWISNAGEEKAARSIDESLRKLQTDYIDLLLIHQAYGDVFGSWRAMEKAYRDGKVRAIGVSNFQAARFFDFAHYVDVKPMVNQLQCNVMIQQRGIEPVLDATDTKMMAWGPLGGQGVDGIVKSDALASIGYKYGKSAAQVALRWLTQRGIVAIPKSVKKEEPRHLRFCVGAGRDGADCRTEPARHGHGGLPRPAVREIPYRDLRLKGRTIVGARPRGSDLEVGL